MFEGVQTLPGRDAAASLLRWWRDAGVDTLVEDHAKVWLRSPLSAGERGGERMAAAISVAEGSVPAPVSSRAAALSIGKEQEPLPPTLPDLLAWMRDSAGVPEAGWGRSRLLPSGDMNAALMILIDMPEHGDAEAGRLLAGEVGDLFDRMLGAIGHSRETIWLAPIATARKVGRLGDAEANRLAEIARHQITLIAPKRLLIMGKTPNELLIGPSWAETRGGYHNLNLGDLSVEAVATFHPRLLHERPKYKAEAWKDLQLLTKGL